MSQGSNPSARTLRDMSTPEGVVTKNGGNYHYKYFFRDYLGNVRLVSRTFKGSGGSVQFTEEQEAHYDPLGLAISKIGNDNPYLYNGKELYSDFSDVYDGVYDFGARYYNPLYGRWFAPDPEKQHPNPYIYCGNNPVMKIDPDGRFWGGDINIFNKWVLYDQKWQRRMERKQNRVENRMNKHNERDKRYGVLKSKYDRMGEEVQMIEDDLNTLFKMKEDPNYTFIAKPVTLQVGDEIGIYKDGNNIIIPFTNNGTFGHERKHIGQSYRKGRFEFSSDNNRLINAIDTEHFKNTKFYDGYLRSQKIGNEIEAYKFQFLIDGPFQFQTLDGAVWINNMNDITPHIITNIIDRNGRRPYAFD